MNPRLLADENVSHDLVAACLVIDRGFPIMHIARWRDGACLQLKDPALLMTLRDDEVVLVSFDRRSLAHDAGLLTREGVGHAGVILYRGTVSRVAYGAQARLLVHLWREASEWDWADRIVHLPGTRPDAARAGGRDGWDLNAPTGSSPWKGRQSASAAVALVPRRIAAAFQDARSCLRLSGTRSVPSLAP